MIKEKLQNIFRDVFDEEDIIIFDEMTAKDLEDWDSLMHMNLIIAIEENFNIKFSLDEVVELNNVAEIIKKIEEKGV